MKKKLDASEVAARKISLDLILKKLESLEERVKGLEKQSNKR